MKLISLGSSSKGNCHIINFGDYSLMLDIGIPFGDRNNIFSQENVVGILVTHEHTDHIKGFKQALTGSIKIYSHYDALDKIDKPEWNKVFIENKTPFKIKDVKILPFEVPHDVRNYAYLFEYRNTKTLFITDCGMCNQFTIPNITNFIIECNFDEDEIDKTSEKYGRMSNHRFHVSLQELKVFLEKNVNENTKSITLIHISASMKDYKRFEREIKAIYSNIQVKAINNHIKRNEVEETKLYLNEDLIDINLEM